MQTDRRLRSNARHERTLAPAAPTDHSRRRRITTNRKPHRSTTTPAPTRHPARSAQIRPCSPSQPINLHSLATFRPHWTTPRFPPSRLIRRLPIRPAAHSHSCGRRQASNNPKRKYTHVGRRREVALRSQRSHRRPPIELVPSTHSGQITLSKPVSRRIRFCKREGH